jgi:hypothetical protein
MDFATQIQECVDEVSSTDGVSLLAAFNSSI